MFPEASEMESQQLQIATTDSINLNFNAFASSFLSISCIQFSEHSN